jgi:hypothetical protein
MPTVIGMTAQTAAVGLALMYPAYQWSVQQLLATMDISAHPI